jgi:hypothetical protein
MNPQQYVLSADLGFGQWLIIVLCWTALKRCKKCLKVLIDLSRLLFDCLVVLSARQRAVYPSMQYLLFCSLSLYIYSYGAIRDHVIVSVVSLLLASCICDVVFIKTNEMALICLHAQRHALQKSTVATDRRHEGTVHACGT